MENHNISLFQKIKAKVGEESSSLKIISNFLDSKKRVNDETTSILKSITESVSTNDLTLVKNKISSFKKGELSDVWDKVLQLWDICISPDVEWSKKAIALGALVYAITTLDAIPDMLPGIGLVDDAAAILFAFKKLNFNKKSNMSKIQLKEDNIDKETLISKINIIVSILSHCASSDSSSSSIEKKKCNEIINLFILSEEGIASDKILEELKIKRKVIEDQIKSIFNSPMDMVDIYNSNLLVKIDHETLYLYAYAIAYADKEVNSEERFFLDELCVKLCVNNQADIENRLRYS